MKHDELPEMAAERYLMNELAAADRDAFREHFSDCALCATQVRAGFAIREQALNPREVRDPMPVKSREPSRWHWKQLARSAMPAAASFVIAVAGMYVGWVRPLLQPGVATSARLIMVRSEELPTVENSRGPASLIVTIEDDGGRSTPYTYSIIGSTKGVLYTRTFTADQINASDEFAIVIPRGTLAPGEYTLRIDTKPRISTYLFRVRE